LSRLHFLQILFGFIGGFGAQCGLVPVVTRYLVLDFDFGLGGNFAVVDLGIDQRERYFRHAGGLAVVRAGEDDVFHPGTAQDARRLLAQYPGDRVANVGFSAPVRTDDGGYAFAVELQFGAIAEGLETENLKLLKL